MGSLLVPIDTALAESFVAYGNHTRVVVNKWSQVYVSFFPDFVDACGVPFRLVDAAG